MARSASSRRQFALIGTVLGLALASAGTFVFSVPVLVYGLHGNARFFALVGGPVFYGAVWSLVMFPLDRLFGLIDTTGAAPSSAWAAGRASSRCAS